MSSLPIFAAFALGVLIQPCTGELHESDSLPPLNYEVRLLPGAGHSSFAVALERTVLPSCSSLVGIDAEFLFAVSAGDLDSVGLVERQVVAHQFPVSVPADTPFLEAFAGMESRFFGGLSEFFSAGLECACRIWWEIFDSPVPVTARAFATPQGLYAPFTFRTLEHGGPPSEPLCRRSDPLSTRRQ